MAVPLFLGETREEESRKGDGRKRKVPEVFRWSSNVHHFLGGVLVARLTDVAGNLYCSEERLTFQKWKEAEEAHRSVKR